MECVHAVGQRWSDRPATSLLDKFIFHRVFDASVGTYHQAWEGVISSDGVGKCNSNGLLCLRKCAEHDLMIIQSFVHQTATRHSGFIPIQKLAPHRLCHSAENR